MRRGIVIIATISIMAFVKMVYDFKTKSEEILGEIERCHQRIDEILVYSNEDFIERCKLTDDFCINEYDFD